MTMTTEALWQPAGQQQAFRRILEAMAHPGRLQNLDDAPRTVLATLLDGGVSLCDRDDLLAPADWPLLGATPAGAAHADFLLADAGRAPDFIPRLGSLTDPEQSTTLVLWVTALGVGDIALRLSGPGIPDVRELRLEGLHPDWLSQRTGWVDAFPLGVDIILADSGRIACLPRTTRVEVR